jgi:hypothetical protein
MAQTQGISNSADANFIEVAEARRFQNCTDDFEPCGRSGMWLEKLFTGVLRVLTPLRARYIQPSFVQRIYLLWIFRHFRVLPLQVLTPRQRRVIDALCVEPRFVPLTEKDGWEAPIIGTLERRPPIAPAPLRGKGRVTDAVSPFAADLSNADS